MAATVKFSPKGSSGDFRSLVGGSLVRGAVGAGDPVEPFSFKGVSEVVIFDDLETEETMRRN